MSARLLLTFVLLLTSGPASRVGYGSQNILPEDRVLGDAVEIRLPPTTRTLAESLASIARASGVLIGFETVLDTDEGLTRSQFGWSPRGQRVGDALDSLLVLHPDYQWRSVDGVIHVRPRAAMGDPGHFLNRAAGPIELKDALPLHATFKAHRVFIPDCVVKHPIYTDERDDFLAHEDKAMRQRVTMSFKHGTVLDLLDAVIKAHGALHWNVTYRVPPDRLHEGTPRYEYAVFGFSASPQVGGWWRMCFGKHADR